MVITSNFTQIDSIEVRDGVVAFRVMDGNTIKRIVSDSSVVNVRRGGGELAKFNLQFDSNTITTDLAIWDTLAYYQNQLRTYYGTESRFLSDNLNLSFMRDNLNNRQNVTLTVQNEGSTSSVQLNLDWTRMSEVIVNQGSITAQARNGTLASEFLSDISTLVVDNGAVQFSRQDGTFRTVFPDGTDIFTPAQLSNNSDILPYDTGFRTRNYNNLGADILPTCPCSTDIKAHT